MDKVKPKWATDLRYALCDQETLCFWNGRGWSDDLGDAVLYVTRSAAEKAARQSRRAAGGVAVCVRLALPDETIVKLLAVKALWEARKQRPLF